MSIGLRGPTNLFGHPTDELLTEIDSVLSQWNSQSVEPVTKISFGHFPLSFSGRSYSGKSLKNIFLKHALSAYLCGHLHTGFGKNLKCHHRLGNHFFQLNIYSTALESTKNCSSIALPPVEEFWEWEMGDWRKSRAMRIVAIDSGFVSFLDMDFKLGLKKTIILPTFPLDSRFMSTSSSLHKYKCHSIDYSSYETVRALVFSVSPIMSVVARVYDSEPGSLDMVMEAQMSKHVDNSSRGDLYTAVWNFKAFENPSPVRYWLQIEAIDIMGRSSLTELRPFSINGLSGGQSWTWREFMVMGCQWASLYYPIFWACLLFIFSILIIPKVLTFTKGPYTYKSFCSNKGFVSGITWVLVEFCRLSVVWFGMVGYLFYLILFPWFSGQVFTDGSEERKYMTYKGWVVQIFGDSKKLEFIGSPDIMVVVLSHLCFVVLPSVLVAAALAAEKGGYRVEFLSLSGKKEDDYGLENNNRSNREISKFWFYKRWIRKILLVFCLPVCWKHLKVLFQLLESYG